MRAGMSFKRIAVALAFAAGGAVSAQGQIMYAGPGTIVQQQFWNPQVYGYNTYPYLAPGPYAYTFIAPPGGAILTPRGYLLRPPGPIPQPFTYGYPPNLYRSPIPRAYGPPPQARRGYQPRPNRPRFVNPYDPPAPRRQDAAAQDDTSPPQKQDLAAVPEDGTVRVNGSVEGRTKGLQPQGHVTPGGSAPDGPAEQAGKVAAGQESKGTAIQADPNRPAN